MTKNEIISTLENKKTRGAWSAGVKEYALEIADNLDDIIDYTNRHSLERDLLNGADNWEHYSWSGCALCYDRDIAFRLCNPTELKKTNGGRNNPNAREDWLDTQARALFQAELMIADIVGAKEVRA